MPDELLRFVTGPAPIGWLWLWLPVGLLALLVGWYVTVVVMTRPREGRGVVQRARDALDRRRSLTAVQRIRTRVVAGEIDVATAGAELNRTLRGFLQRATGSPVEYMRVSTLTSGDFASTATLFARLDDVRFNIRSTEDPDDLGAEAEKVIASWS